MHIRPTHVAGSFYDGNAKTLNAYLEQSFQAVQSSPCAQDDAKTEAQMVFLPHAGHFFCGHVIAQTLSCVRLPKRLIILCPNHTGLGRPLSVWGAACADGNIPGAWQTPLGTVPLDAELSERVLNCLSGDITFELNTDAHAREHSIEVILPFLQKFIPNFHMLPISVGTGDFKLLQKAGMAIGEIVKKFQDDGQDIGIIVSSDMHHFSSHERTLELDNLALDALKAFDPINLYNIVHQNKISMCGIYPTIMAMYACKVLGAQHCELVTHTTSYEKGGDATRVVGYAGLFVQKRTCFNS